MLKRLAVSTEREPLIPPANSEASVRYGKFFVYNSGNSIYICCYYQHKIVINDLKMRFPSTILQ